MIKSLGEVEATIEEMDDGRLEHIERLIHKIKSERKNKLRFPIETKFYSHTDKDSNYTLAAKHKLSDEQIEEFKYAGGEVEFDIIIAEDGSVTATHINGVKITKPVRL